MCRICTEQQNPFCDRHKQMLDDGWTVDGWKRFDDGYFQVSTKKLDDTDKRLNQTVRQGKAHGKNINNLRSKYKNGGWHYEYIK